MSDKLTPKQIAAYCLLADKWESAYSLQCHRGTLEALVRKGYAERRRSLGWMFFPRTGIEYRKLYKAMF